jgi:hypothetical protein
MGEIPTTDWTWINTAADRFELEIRLLQSEAAAVILYDPVFPSDPFAR